jgi:transcriptional regulator of acetoin/glycerol metabolism
MDTGAFHDRERPYGTGESRRKSGEEGRAHFPAVRTAAHLRFESRCDLSGKPQTECFHWHHLHLLAAIASTVTLKLGDTEYDESIRDENEWLQDFAKPNLELLGNSAQIQQVRDFIQSVAGTDSTVLILGESGTGKEVVARRIRHLSPRSKRAYHAVNCGALVDTLIENELFGHERGAFTGATELKKGKIELTNGGTLFLDEIGEMPLSTQVKLLRVLQEHEIQRVGGTTSIHVDVRIIAATKRDLKQLVEQGRFRLDLYYRLNVVDIRTPSRAPATEQKFSVTELLFSHRSLRSVFTPRNYLKSLCADISISVGEPRALTDATG